MSILGAASAGYIGFSGFGTVTTLKTFTSGLIHDIDYSLPMDSWYLNRTPSGGNATMYSTPNSSVSTLTSIGVAVNVSGSRYATHPTQQRMYYRGSSTSAYNLNLVALTQTSTNAWASNPTAVILNPSATILAAPSTGTSITTAPIDASGNVGARTTFSMPGGTFTNRGASYSPETGNLWIVRYDSTLIQLSALQYTPTGSSLLSTTVLTGITENHATAFDWTLAANNKWYYYSGGAVYQYDLNTHTNRLVAGIQVSDSTSVDGIGEQARFRSIGALRYIPALSLLAVGESGAIRLVNITE